MIETNNPSTGQFRFRMPRVRDLKLIIRIPRPTTPLSSTFLLAYLFAAFIIFGTLILILPVSSASGDFTHPIDALFTATSAVCVTGLTVLETAGYWSTFGHAVLLVLFQVGGLGFIIGATLLLLAIGGRFGLKERLVMSESLGVDRLGGVLGIAAKIVVFALVTEVIGALLLYFYWASSGDTSITFWTALFHTISAFNNCGMDIFRNSSSLSAYGGDAVVLLVTILMIFLGSTGYFIIADIARKRQWAKLAFETKIVLATTGVIIASGTLFYLVAEFSNPATLGPLGFFQKVLGAFFQSITTRTAGFSAFDMGSLSQIALFFTIILMCIGGAAGSVAGGVKVNTIGIIGITIINMFKGKDNIDAFGRQITRQTIYRALALLAIYLAAAGFIVTLLFITENFPIDNIIFETFSALGTVGLSTGITPDLSIAGKIIIIFTMFLGRLGPIALMAFLVHRKQPETMEYPYESIRLG